MSYFSVDVESDAQSPSVGSMVSFGAVMVDNPSITFYGKVKPICDTWEPEALAVSGFSREEHEQFDDPKEVMIRFEEWLSKYNDRNSRPTFISDNPAFDWQWINYYFHKYLGRNPFGHSARRIGDLYCGLVKDARKNRDWKKLRKTKHTHNPVDDAKGNAEALKVFRDELDLYIKF